MQTMAVERLSGVDRAWLLMERPVSPMMVLGVIFLDGKLGRMRLREIVAERFLAFDRFRCVPVGEQLGARWLLAAHFDIDDHVLSIALPAAAGQHELEALVGQLASTPLSPERPLWSFHLVERYGAGSAIIVRIHHCYADGIALIRVLLALADGESGIPHARVPPPELEPAALTALVPDFIWQTLREGVGLIEKGTHYALHPLDAFTAVQEGLGLAGELAHLTTLSDDPPTRLRQPLCGVRRVAWADPLSLEEVRTVGRVLGCTVNDVLVSTLAGALGRYLELHGDEVSGATIRATVPVNLRPEDELEPSLGNRFGLVFVELPIGIRHPLERLYAVHTAMQKLKSSPQALAVLGLLSVIGSLPAAVEDPVMTLFSAKASLVASNLPGPRSTLHVGGVPVTRLLFWVPPAGSIGTGVSMLTYRGQVQFGVIADRQLIPKPAELVKLIGIEFERLVFLVLLGAGSLGD
jgi:diacylglycerol O-acyltransferase / wax synthase